MYAQCTPNIEIYVSYKKENIRKNQQIKGNVKTRDIDMKSMNELELLQIASTVNVKK